MMWESANLRSLAVECLHKGLLIALILMCLISPVGTLIGTFLSVAMISIATMFVIVDLIRLATFQFLRNAFVIATYLLTLFCFVYFYGSAAPNFEDEILVGFKKYGASLVSTCICAAVMEEVLFRRYAQTHLQRIMPMNWALVVNALVFTAMHGRLAMDLFFAGVAFGILASYFQCIYAAMVIHAMSNFVGMMGLYLHRTDETLTASLVLLGSWASSFVVLFSLLLSSLLIRRMFMRQSDPNGDLLR